MLKRSVDWTALSEFYLDCDFYDWIWDNYKVDPPKRGCWKLQNDLMRIIYSLYKQRSF